MGQITDKQEEIISGMGAREDRMDKYEYLIEAGKALGPPDKSIRTEDNLLNGCQSSVWLEASFSGGRMFIKADSDARITRGMLALIIRVLNGQSPGDIAASDLYFIERSGLASHLSPSRANGLYSVVESIKSLAKKMLHEHVEKDLSGEK